MAKTVAGVTTKYLVDDLNPTGFSQVVLETTSTGTTVQYVYGLERISQNRLPTTGSRQLSFYGYDDHGSVRQLTDPTGALTDTYTYDAFGNLIGKSGTTPNNYLFAGEQFDPDLGLYYNRARRLNTSTGRFWTMDSDEGEDSTPLTLHKYLYASADPVNTVDPTGNQGLEEFASIGSIISTLANLSVPLFAAQGGVPGVELRTDAPKESTLVFPARYGFQDLGLHDTSFAWTWAVELKGTVPLGQSTSDWMALQSYTGSSTVTFGKSGGRFERLNVPNDNPDPRVVQRTRNHIYWIDAPGFTKRLGFQRVQSVTQVQNFTSSIQKGNQKFELKWHLKLVVIRGPQGPQLDRSVTDAGTGHIPE